MNVVTRRSVLRAGGLLLAAGAGPRLAFADSLVVEIGMRGDASGANVWFDPIGLHVLPGQTIRWTNLDAGNSHTSTAFHPAFDNHTLRIPAAAQPWNSDYLLPNESFSVTLTVEGVYDYFCIPHEHAGMVGRIVVGDPQDENAPGEESAALPSTREILSAGRISPMRR